MNILEKQLLKKSAKKGAKDRLLVAIFVDKPLIVTFGGFCGITYLEGGGREQSGVLYTCIKIYR
jgi:hypothetical protein